MIQCTFLLAGHIINGALEVAAIILYGVIVGVIFFGIMAAVTAVFYAFELAADFAAFIGGIASAALRPLTAALTALADGFAYAVTVCIEDLKKNQKATRRILRELRK